MADRLGIRACRQLLGAAAAGMSDGAIEQLRDQLYVVAELVIACGPQRRYASTALTNDHKDELDERAAIMEFDGNMNRTTAERAATHLVLANSRGRSRRRPH